MSHALSYPLGLLFSSPVRRYRRGRRGRRGDRAVRQKGRMLRAGLFRVSLRACVRTVRACVRARMRHGRRGARRMRDPQLGPDHGGRRVVRSTEAWRVEPATAVGGPPRRREGHTMQDGSGELLIFCHCKLIYSMGPLLSPPPCGPRIVCPMGPRCSKSSVPPSALVRSLSPCPLLLYLGSRAHSRCLRRCCLAATCHRLYPRCATLRRAFVAPFFSPAKRGISLFFLRDHRRRPHRKICLRFIASWPCTTFYVNLAGQMSVAMFARL